MADYTEVEVKLYVPDLAAVARRLDALHARRVGERVYERNVRYENAERTLTPAGVVVRLRQDTRVRLTYKEGGELVGGAHSRFEAEVEVSDFETMQTILAKLGYTPAWVYEKHRTTYTFDGVEVVLDEMPYGNFVEIEGDSPEAIGRVVERLELGDAQRFDAGYGALFERVRRVLGLTFTDLTFENFRGVNVPQSAFEG